MEVALSTDNFFITETTSTISPGQADTNFFSGSPAVISMCKWSKWTPWPSEAVLSGVSESNAVGQCPILFPDLGITSLACLQRSVPLQCKKALPALEAHRHSTHKVCKVRSVYIHYK